MAYFMVSLDGEDNGGWEKNFEVEATIAVAAVALALAELNPDQRTLHNIHIGPGCEQPTSDEEMRRWPEEDWFERISGV